MLNQPKSPGYTIDAAGRTIGRVASEAAKALIGKTQATYEPRIASRMSVRVSNSAKLRITQRKRLQKVYQTYSGHPGGLRSESLGQLMARKGAAEALRRAIFRMLPRNTHRAAHMKRLHIAE